MDVFKEYRFEAAHYLPKVAEGHPCGRMHGHSYRVVVHVSGRVHPDLGWVIDFARIDEAFAPLRESLDHQLLNHIEGLDNPTCEILASWIFKRLAKDLDGLSRLECWETADAGCIMTAGG